MNPTSWSGRVAAVPADRIAVLGSDGPVTYGELRERAAALAGWLDDLGAPAGRPVGAVVDSSATALALVVAGAATGRPVAPLNPRHTATELAAVCAAVDPSLVVADPASADVIDGSRVIPGRPRAARLPSQMGSPSGSGLAAVLHTSGTTGPPRPVRVRQDRLVARTELYRSILGVGPDSVLATTSPFHHTTALGMAFVTLGVGATWIGVDRFTVEAYAARVAGRATHVVVVPTMIDRLLDADGLGADTAASTFVYGGAPMPPPLMERLVEAVPGVAVHQIYGQTEGSPLFHLDAADHVAIAAGDHRLTGSVGRAVAGVTAAIADPDHAGVGELLARAGHLFSPGADGWLHTGDLGVIDDDGYLFLRGRLADRIVRGGENVDPSEVEAVLAAHPTVADVAVVGVADEHESESVVAFVVPTDPGGRLDEASLVRHARDVLAGYKVPTRWVVVTEIPRNQTGKVLRRALIGG
ncbi:MAG: class I adenylate-forming enzyme family protein [Acidimicrobiales bacterium]